MALKDIVTGILEGGAVRQFGPGWKQKIAQQEAQTAETNATTASTAAGTEIKKVQLEEIHKAMSDADRKRAALIAAGINPDIADEVAKKELHQSLLALHGAQTKHAEAQAELEQAQAARGGFRPATAGAGGFVWAVPPEGGQAKLTPKAQAASGGFTQPPPAQTVNREFQAGNVIKSAGQLKAMIQKNAGVIGPRAGRYQGLKQGAAGILLGGPDPGYAETNSLLGSFEALLPALHGYRGGAAVHDLFKNAMGGGLNQPPENLYAAINAVTLLAQDIQSGRAQKLLVDAKGNPIEEGTGGTVAPGPAGPGVGRPAGLPAGWEPVP